METRDYSKFKFLKENREVKEATVNKIIASVKEWGIIPGRPVLIDGMGNIIDGQHRFTAYKQLNMPIPYEVINGDVIGKTMALNASQKQWSLLDYCTSYANQGKECYRILIKAMEKYKYPISMTVDVVFGYTGYFKTSNMRKGMDMPVYERHNELLDMYDYLKDKGVAIDKDIARALVITHKIATPEQIEVLKDNYIKIKRTNGMYEYLVQIENIINFKKRGKNVIRLTDRRT